MDINKIHFWKIAINIHKSYIQAVFQNTQNNHVFLKENEEIIVNFNEYKILTKDENLIFKKNSPSDFLQALKILYYLNIFKFKNEEDHWDKDFDINKNKFLDKLKNTNNTMIFTAMKNEKEDIYKSIMNFLINIVDDKTFFEENNVEKSEFLNSIFLIFLYIENKNEYKTIVEHIYKNNIRENSKSFEITTLASYNDFCLELKQALIDYNKKDLFINKLEEYYSNFIHIKYQEVKKDYNENINQENFDFIPNHEYKKIKNKDKNVLKINANAENLYFFIQEINCNDNLIYEIPIYQRKYRWDEQLVINLLMDIKKNRNNKNDQHYIGQILMSKNDNNFKIIDGQQRLSTLFLITKALLFITKKEIKFKDFVNKVKNIDINGDFSLLHQIINVDYFFNRGQKIINHFKRIEGNSDFDNFYSLWSNKIIGDNFIHLTFVKILKWLKTNLQTEELLEQFWNSLLNKMIFVKVIIDSENDFEIFEKTNTRNLPLNVIELLKNKIFHFAQTKLHENINEKEFQNNFEQQIIKKLYTSEEIRKNKLSDSKIENFIKSLYMPESDRDSILIVSQKWYYKLWNYMEKNYDMVESYKVILNKLSFDITIFNEITDFSIYTIASHRFFPIADYLSSLASDSKHNFVFLIKKVLELTLMDQFENLEYKMTNKQIEKIRDLLKPMEIFEIRTGLKIEGQSNRNDLEKIYNKVVEFVNENGFQKLNSKVLFNFFNNQYTGNIKLDHISKMQEKIANNTIKSAEQKMIISRFEKFWETKSYDEQVIQSNQHSFKVQNSIEHIMPQKIDMWLEEYEKTLDDKEKIEAEKEKYIFEHKEFVDYIGNILLLKLKDNSKVQNIIFDKKIKHYKTTSNLYKIYKTINGFNEVEIENIKMDLKKLIQQDKTWWNNIYSEKVINNTFLNKKFEVFTKDKNYSEEEKMEKALMLYLDNEFNAHKDMNLLELKAFNSTTIKNRSKIISWIMVLALQDIK